jgi:hypothetical protein
MCRLPSLFEAIKKRRKTPLRRLPVNANRRRVKPVHEKGDNRPQTVLH